jgi:hypothetical protein
LKANGFVLDTEDSDMRIFLAIVACVAMQSNTNAQQSSSPLMAVMQVMEGTTSATYLPQFANGKLTACLIEFGALVRDNSARVGQYSRVGGSFGFMSAEGTIAPVMKVIVHDVNLATGNLIPAPPRAAYVAYGTGTNVNEVAGTNPSDTPGAVFVVFKQGKTTEVFMNAIVDQKIRILFNRNGNGMDIPVNIDLSVEDTARNGERRRSDKATTEMTTCILALAKADQN